MARNHLFSRWGRQCGLLLALAVAGPGCTSKTTEQRKAVHPVQGKVFVQKQPAVGAFVLFVPVNEGANPTDPRPRAEVKEDGSFTLSTYGDADGAPAGEYVVTITWPGKVLPDGREEPADKLNGRYADPQRSKLRATVKDGKNELDPFQL
jgi:hypothetical protein